MGKVHQIARLRKASNGLCICCAKPLPKPRNLIGKSAGRKIVGPAPTLEHVFPRALEFHSLPPTERRRVSALRRMVAPLNVVAVAHQSCNVAKAHRPPTACEVIFLMAVQERNRIALGKSFQPIAAPPWALFDDA